MGFVYQPLGESGFVVFERNGHGTAIEIGNDEPACFSDVDIKAFDYDCRFRRYGRCGWFFSASFFVGGLVMNSSPKSRVASV